MTDLEKFKKFFDDLGVNYDINTHEDKRYIRMRVDSYYREDIDLYYNEVIAIFNLDESFDRFKCCDK